MQLTFQLTQHYRDKQLMDNCCEYLDCGKYRKELNKDVGQLVVVKLSDLTGKVIPLFLKHPIRGIKSKDFEDFCKVASILKEKGHLTIEGINKIKEIKEGMNTGRKHD